jgi:hypothetical protein
MCLLADDGDEGGGMVGGLNSNGSKNFSLLILVPSMIQSDKMTGMTWQKWRKKICPYTHHTWP